MLARLLVYCAYFLESSRAYQNTKRFFYDLLENTNSRMKAHFDMFMICLVMFSVILLIYEVDTPPTNLEIVFERAIVLVFALEYVLRGWLYNDSHKIIIEYHEQTQYLKIPFRFGKAMRMVIGRKIDYMLSPLAIIDLLAILPSYRSLRILRIFLIFRLFKLLRYFNSIKLFTEVLSSKRFELFTLMIFLGFIVLIGSTAIYLFEKPTANTQVNNLFDAAYFTIVTVSTVGYGDITPHSTGGRLVAMMLILSGLGVFSFLTSILVSGFNDKMRSMQENRTYTELKRHAHFVIICGFGRVGEHIAKLLAKDRKHFVVIDIDEKNVLEAKRLGYLVIHADASKNNVLLNAGINNGATSVLCTTGNDVINVYITLSSRYLNPTIRIISRANQPDNVKKLYQAGANDIIQPFAIAAMVAAEYVGQPVAFEAIQGILRKEKQLLMEAVAVLHGSALIDKSIAALDFEQRKLILIGVISSHAAHHRHRKNRYDVNDQQFYFNPDPHFILQEGDLLVLMGRDVSIDHFRNQFKGSQRRP
ncbi:MAG: NAD-binding protein [Methylovulum sp.]|uniref:potassium channel protein n=1 Tax=Methylovulum sp. TaxID=1916980 RepID=UPI002627D7DE|nr:potassium channel protein [Methylovulum sp.]MDD2723370.1 NAD-binding protein [Methylovulum sp.]MDD5124263.1 NAD-binding protein [Methylovulum sp.]